MARRSGRAAPGRDADRATRRAEAQQRARRTAEAQAAAERQRKREVRRQVLLGLAVVVAIAAVFTVLVLRAEPDRAPSVDPAGLPAAGATPYSTSIGPADAPHKVIIYEDFICPYCGEVEAASHQGLAAAAAAGKVYVEYRPFDLLQTPWSAQALNAFAAIRTMVGQAAAKDFHDLVYAHQPEEPGPSDAREQLVALADQVVPAAQQPKVDAAIRDANSQRAWTDAATAAAARAGVVTTPTVVLDGRVFEEGSTATELGQRLVEAVQ